MNSWERLQAASVGCDEMAELNLSTTQEFPLTPRCNAGKEDSCSCSTVTATNKGSSRKELMKRNMAENTQQSVCTATI